jgi:hypothetical protein
MELADHQPKALRPPVVVTVLWQDTLERSLLAGDMEDAQPYPLPSR